MPFCLNANRVLVKALIMCLLSVIRGKNVGFLYFCWLETFALNNAYIQCSLGKCFSQCFPQAPAAGNFTC